jgi:RNA polymerase sigma-70 factor (ECF subfamily)
MRIIDRLPEAQKQVITMRDIEGLDYPDIAQAIGMTEINVRVSLSRARKYVREAIKQQMRQ